MSSDEREIVVDAFLSFLRKELYDIQTYGLSVVYWFEQTYPVISEDT